MVKSDSNILSTLFLSIPKLNIFLRFLAMSKLRGAFRGVSWGSGNPRNIDLQKELP